MSKNLAVSAYSLATTFAIVYTLCSIFDAAFPPYGLIAVLAPASPWPLSGSLLGFATGFLVFAIAGLAVGSVHGAATMFWNRRIR